MICVMLMACGVAGAMSKRIALTSELENLGHFIDVFHEQVGKYPQTWGELEKINPGLDGTFSTLQPTQRMILMSPPIELPRRYGGGIALAITREPFRPQGWTQWPITWTSREFLKDPSYALLVSVDGRVLLRYVPPATTRSIFEAAGVALPEPSGLGPFPYEKNFMMRRSFSWAAIVAFSSWLIWLLVRRIQKKRTIRGSRWA